VQARWSGSAAGASPDLRLEVRQVERGRKGAWRPL
jgi:hypothetical protein